MNTDDIPEEIRAELDGKPFDPPTFNAWLSSLPSAEQDELFGAAAMKRFRAGNMTTRELLLQPKRTLTLDEFAGRK